MYSPFVDWTELVAEPETSREFGRPKNNSSIVYVRCVCSSLVRLTVRSLKGNIKVGREPSCKPCRQRVVSRRLWEDPEYRDKHKAGCTASYADGSRKKALSESSKRMWRDPVYRDKVLSAKEGLWEDPEYRRKQAAFRDGAYRSERSREQKKRWEDPSYRDRMSAMVKALWSDDVYRKKVLERLSEVRGSARYREMISSIQSSVWKRHGHREKMRALWDDPEYRSKLSRAVKECWDDDSFRKRCSESSRRKWMDPSYREKTSEAIRSVWRRPSYRSLKTSQSRDMWRDEAFRAAAARSRASQSGKESSIEAATRSILDSMGIEYVPQFPLGPYVFDFFLPESRSYVECQGEYWHSLPGREARDRAKATYLEKADPGAPLLYLMEHDFMSPGFVVSKIGSFLGSDVPERPFRMKEASFVRCGSAEASSLLKSFHYIGAGRSAKAFFGAMVSDELVAVCKFSRPVRKETATSMGMRYDQVLELDRLCIRPERRKRNLASWLISRSSSAVFDEYPEVECLVSFADLTFGHSGTVYRAAGWKHMSTVRPDYHYVGKDGWVVHKKTLYNRAVKNGMREREYAEKHGYRKFRGKEKRKFVLCRDKSRD